MVKARDAAPRRPARRRMEISTPDGGEPVVIESGVFWKPSSWSDWERSYGRDWLIYGGGAVCFIIFAEVWGALTR
ncbi:hypothetical protein [Parvularcula maris]|uniref:Uncharacterized protein n=1 Tax=Parvularcula maris TaxID=2965077 RepID=A0A9X2LAP5_9PROT|nr:hypothetical protein [Parvularcula maris]MCQ8186009.1 hypothetical protein [Parvularcula maris]